MRASELVRLGGTVPLPNRFMTHIAAHEVDDTGNPVTGGEHVTDASMIGNALGLAGSKSLSRYAVFAADEHL